MKHIVSEQIEYYQFESFDPELIFHGIFTRKGGVSPDPWKSLNQGGTVGDERTNVVENRRRVFEVIGRPVESIYDVWQIHSTDVINAHSPRPLDAEHIKADAIVTDKPEVTLFMRFADCVPILLYDPVHKVGGIIHAGWMGTVNQIVTHTLENLQRTYQCEPKNIVAGIGPSIGVCHYEVGENVISAAQKSFGAESVHLLIERDGKTYFDLWKANEFLLRKAGVRSVEISGLCTACHTEDWYSHRAEAGKTGRFGAALFLRQGIGYGK
jgi:YfiH family protein